MKIIDVHNHLYPVAWMNYLEGRPGSPTMKRTGPTNVVFTYNGMRLATVSRAGHYDPVPRLADLKEYGIDIQILSLTTPSVELVSASEGVAWAKKVNDYFAELCREYKGLFYAYATLPFQDVPESLRELERAHKELKVRGITMFSNINGKPIYGKEFWPIYEMAEAYDLPVFIHPAPPVTTDIMNTMQMPLPLYGFILDTTMAVTGLIFQGVLERFPRLKLIHAHLGGVFPYMVERVNDSFKSYAKDHGFSLPGLPSDYYKRQVYVDAISFHVPAMKCALEYLGVDHILVGTDYAHPVGGPDRIIGCIRELGLPKSDLEKIFWKNAVDLFKLDIR